MFEEISALTHYGINSQLLCLKGHGIVAKEHVISQSHTCTCSSCSISLSNTVLQLCTDVLNHRGIFESDSDTKMRQWTPTTPTATSATDQPPSPATATSICDSSTLLRGAKPLRTTGGKWPLRQPCLAKLSGTTASSEAAALATAAAAADPTTPAECGRDIVCCDSELTWSGGSQAPNLLHGMPSSDSEKHFKSDLVWVQLPTLQSDGSVNCSCEGTASL
jgi:hypothetical protein